MERSRGYLRMRSGILLLYLTLAAFSLTHCDAERSMRVLRGPKHGRILTHKLKTVFKHFQVISSLDLDSSNVVPYSISSSSPLPPYECLYPPNPPSTGLPTQSPPGSLPTPTTQSVPGSPEIQNPPITVVPGPPGSSPSPPSNVPGSPEPVQNPPIIIPGPPGSTTSPPSSIPSPAEGNPPGSPDLQNPPIILPGPPGSTTSPPSIVPSPTAGSAPGNPPIILPGPPSIVPSPTAGSAPGSPYIQTPPIILPGPSSPTGGTVPSPTVFEPPVVFPPPSVPPPPYRVAPSGALWCVAKPSVPDPIIQEAMNYACGSGADCDSLQPNGPCFQPDTVFAHASYAFNSYWQNTKVAGGTCDFGGTGMLVSVDPSYDGCYFVYN